MRHRILLCFLSIGIHYACGQGSALGFLASQNSASATKGVSIYASHHSFFLPIPGILTEIARAAGLPGQKIIGTDYIGGSKVIQHWNIPDPDNKAKAALISGKVDVLILTPVYLPDDGIEKFAQLGLAQWSRLHGRESIKSGAAPHPAARRCPATGRAPAA